MLSVRYTADDLLRSDIAGADTELSDLQRRAPLEVQRALEDLRTRTLEPLCNILGCRPRITSGYRSPQLNSRVGGRPDSPHIHGRAVDLVLDDAFLEDADGASARAEIEAAIREHGGDHKDLNANFYLFAATILHAGELNVTEIIHEHGVAGRPAWVHLTTGDGPTQIHAIGDYSDGTAMSVSAALVLGSHHRDTEAPRGI